MASKPTVAATCQQCHKEFQADKYERNRGKARFCGQPCAILARRAARAPTGQPAAMGAC